MICQLVAYNAMSTFRANLGEDYIQHNVETIYKMFFQEQALVKLNNHEELEVTIYGHQHAEVLHAMYHNISAKLREQGIDPGISWIGGYPLKFVFITAVTYSLVTLAIKYLFSAFMFPTPPAQEIEESPFSTKRTAPKTLLFFSIFWAVS